MLRTGARWGFEHLVSLQHTSGLCLQHPCSRCQQGEGQRGHRSASIRQQFSARSHRASRELLRLRVGQQLLYLGEKTTKREEEVTWCR